MIATVVVLSIVGCGFIAVILYLLYLKKHHRSIDEDDCNISRSEDLKAYIQSVKKKERKESLKRKRELEKLDRIESKKNRK